MPNEQQEPEQPAPQSLPPTPIDSEMFSVVVKEGAKPNTSTTTTPPEEHR